MLEAIRSEGATKPLETVVAKLASQSRVDAVALIGSEATGEAGLDSDIDLLVVLGEGEIARAPGSPFEVVFTTIGSRPADVILSTVRDLHELAGRDWGQPMGHAAESLIRWIAEGRSLVDRSGLLAEITNRFAAGPPLAWADNDRRSAWWSVNFGLVKARRYAASANDVYRTAAEWVLATTIDEALRAYFTVRALPWRGEKHALGHWLANDLSFLTLLRTLFDEADLDLRVVAAERLAATALGPVGGLWEAGTGPRSDVWESLVC